MILWIWGKCSMKRTAYDTETDELSLVCLDDVHACGYGGSWEDFGITQGSDRACLTKSRLLLTGTNGSNFVVNRYADLTILSPRYYCQKFLHLHTRRHIKD
jgi:hypothetical protein